MLPGAGDQAGGGGHRQWAGGGQHPGGHQQRVRHEVGDQ